MEQINADAGGSPTMNSASDAEFASDAAPTTRRPASLEHLLFLTFVLLSFLLFAAPTVLPEVREYSRLLQEEDALKTEVRRLATRSDHLVQFAAEMTDDRDTNERIVRQELNYKNPGESVVVIPPSVSMDDAEGERTPHTASSTIIPPDWPLWTKQAEIWTASHGVLDPLMDPKLKLTWMLMAAGLLVAAFVLFPAKRRESASVAAGNL